MKRIMTIAMTLVVALLTWAGPGGVPPASAETPTQIKQLEDQLAQGGKRLKQLSDDLDKMTEDLRAHETKGDLSGKELRDRRRRMERLRKEHADLNSAMDEQRGELMQLRSLWRQVKPEVDKEEAARRAADRAFIAGIDQQIQDVRDKHLAQEAIIIRTRRVAELKLLLGQLALEQARLGATGAGGAQQQKVAADTATTIKDITEAEQGLAEERARYQRLGGDLDALDANMQRSLGRVTPAAPPLAPADPPADEAVPAEEPEDTATETPEEKAAREAQRRDIERYGEEGDRRLGFDREDSKKTSMIRPLEALDPDADTTTLVARAQGISAAGGYAGFDPFVGRDLTYSRDRILRAEATRMLGGREAYIRWLKSLKDRGQLGLYGTESEAAAGLLRAMQPERRAAVAVPTPAVVAAPQPATVVVPRPTNVMGQTPMATPIPTAVETPRVTVGAPPAPGGYVGAKPAPGGPAVIGVPGVQLPTSNLPTAPGGRIVPGARVDVPTGQPAMPRVNPVPTPSLVVPDRLVPPRTAPPSVGPLTGQPPMLSPRTPVLLNQASPSLSVGGAPASRQAPLLMQPQVPTGMVGPTGRAPVAGAPLLQAQ